MPLRNKDFHECGGIPVWGHQRNLRVQEGLAAAPMFPVAVPVAAADPFLQKSHAIPRSNNNRELKTAEYQRSDFKPEIQSRELHAKLLRRRQGPAAAPVGGGGHCTRYVVMHPLRGPTPDQNGCNAYGSGAMPTDRVHRTTLEYPKEESAAPHTSPVDRNTRSHKNPKHRRCEGRRRDLPRCRWAAAGPSRASRRPTEPPISTPGTTGVEGAGRICRGAGGRRRGLAELRDDAPNHQSAHQAPLVWRAPEGPAAVPVGDGGAWLRCLRAATTLPPPKFRT